MGFSEPGGLEEEPLEQQPDPRDERGSMEAGRRLWEAGTSQLVLFPQEPREGALSITEQISWPGYCLAWSCLLEVGKGLRFGEQRRAGDCLLPETDGLPGHRAVAG